MLPVGEGKAFIRALGGANPGRAAAADTYQGGGGNPAIGEADRTRDLLRHPGACRPGCAGPLPGIRAGTGDSFSFYNLLLPGAEQDYIIRSTHKQSTNEFYSYATLYAITRNRQMTLAAYPVRQGISKRNP